VLEWEEQIFKNNNTSDAIPCAYYFTLKAVAGML
jgi:hypothetical protein